MTSTTAQDWDTAAAVVRDHADALASMGSHSELYSFAKEKNLATKLLFPKFKTELRKQLRIDYDQIRKDTLAARLVELEAAGETAPTITLFCAGDVEVDSYAVCRAEEEDPWYGTFHENDQVADQDHADESAARKAVYLAGKAREFAGLDIVHLRLSVTNHVVTRTALMRDMLKHKVWVTVDIVDDPNGNPALELCRAPGFRGWREVSLGDLIEDSDGAAQ
ncbi:MULTISPECIES: hypothetical protein [Gordonia]|uniref:Uncharacterized protein n=1 Tax=Gordonia sihwensis NBRC 108236 TaxID=1223544 RepID=L7LMG8_9ACTN|nr:MULTISPECIES: hypothetical protein [Gordonia]WFN95123.1 hypothetical protein P5P27_20350 [Gordonia sihwensis]WFN95146.1 hypothetical protein P5P27_20490 [Gordonia sihwensis]GAC62335.1 hypothetical protein GSI01S_33_00210 [Gordonia sihwensis NBRC 108236]